MLENYMERTTLGVRKIKLQCNVKVRILKTVLFQVFLLLGAHKFEESYAIKIWCEARREDNMRKEENNIQ